MPDTYETCNLKDQGHSCHSCEHYVGRYEHFNDHSDEYRCQTFEDGKCPFDTIEGRTTKQWLAKERWEEVMHLYDSKRNTSWEKLKEKLNDTKD